MTRNLRIHTRIRAVFFDAADTLFHLAESVGEGYAKVAQRHGFHLDPEQTDSAFRIAWKSMPPMGSPIGHNNDRSEETWWRAIVDEVLSQFPDLEIPMRENFFKDLFNSYANPAAWSLYPETIEVLEALHRRDVPLFVLSNFDARLLPVLDGLGLRQFFSDVFYSGKITHAKPSAEIFTYAVGKADLPAAACLHVGDDPIADWQGARDAGLQAFELDRSSQDLSAVLDLKNLPDFSD